MEERLVKVLHRMLCDQNRVRYSWVVLHNNFENQKSVIINLYHIELSIGFRKVRVTLPKPVPAYRTSTSVMLWEMDSVYYNLLICSLGALCL